MLMALFCLLVVWAHKWKKKMLPLVELRFVISWYASPALETGLGVCMYVHFYGHVCMSTGVSNTLPLRFS